MNKIKKSSRIAIPFRIPKWEGGVRYYKSLLQAIDELILEDKLNLNFQGLSVARWLLKHESLALKFNFLLKILDVFRSLFFFSFPQPLSRFSRKSFAWVPDFQDLELPHYFSEMQRNARRKSIDNGIEKGYLFYFSSFHAKRIFEENFGTTHKVAGVVRFSVPYSRKESYSPNSLPIDCNQCEENGFILLPNQWWKHKNHLFFLDTYKKYVVRGGNLHLIMTGLNQDWRNPDHAQQIMQSLKGCSAIHNLGLVSRSDIDILFKKAISIAQPSLYEGWSTSIEEAICSGAGIIASSIELHEEQLIGVKNAKFFKINSSDELLNLLFNLPSAVSEEEAKSQQAIRWRRFKSELRDVINQSQNDI